MANETRPLNILVNKGLKGHLGEEIKEVLASQIDPKTGELKEEFWDLLVVVRDYFLAIWGSIHTDGYLKSDDGGLRRSYSWIKTAGELKKARNRKAAPATRAPSVGSVKGTKILTSREVPDRGVGIPEAGGGD